MISFRFIMLVVGVANVLYASIYTILAFSRKKERFISIYALLGWIGAACFQISLYLDEVKL